jgi:hypothetical protein
LFETGVSLASDTGGVNAQGEAMKKSPDVFHRIGAEAQRAENKEVFLCVSAPLR